jgi:hypothetical protein
LIPRRDVTWRNAFSRAFYSWLADKAQIDVFKKSFMVTFSLFADGNLAIAQAVRMMEAPTMVLVTQSNKVLTSHSGAIRDFDELLKDLRENLKKQKGQ